MSIFILIVIFSAIIAVTSGIQWLEAKDKLREAIVTAEVAAFGWSDDMDPIEFEQRCAEAMRLAGWSASITKGSGDQGVDVIAKRNGLKVIMQCKRYSTKVGNKAVQEAISGKIFTGASRAIVVSNQNFTRSALDLAERGQVLLLHFTELKDINLYLGLPDVMRQKPAEIVKAAEIKLRKAYVTTLMFFALAASSLSIAVLLARNGQNEAEIQPTVRPSEISDSTPPAPVLQGNLSPTSKQGASTTRTIGRTPPKAKQGQQPLFSPDGQAVGRH